jgi:exopolysaccharide biosynthesis polyprenyl glycosylphosphotransferase
MKPIEIFFSLLRIPIDFFMTFLAFLLAFQLRAIEHPLPWITTPFDLGSIPPLEQYFTFSILASLGLLLLFAFSKLYSMKSTLAVGKELKDVIIITSAWLMGIIGYFFLIRDFPFSRLALFYTWMLTIILVCCGRLIVRLMQSFTLHFNIGKERILFIGNNTLTQKLFSYFQKDHCYQVVGTLENEKKGVLSNIPCLGEIKDLPHIVKKYNVQEIIQTKANLRQSELAEISDFCREHHLNFSYVPSLLEVHHSNIEIETKLGIPVVQLKPTSLEGWGKVFKRIYDFTAALLALIILSPLFLIIAILIKLDSKGTIFYKYLDDGERVKRVGEHGKLFSFYKFRTMHPNTHNLRYTRLAGKNTRKDSPIVKIKNDPRVTRVGKFLRKTSIDELPQLINVLKGEMSLVGPRPHLPEEVAKYKKHHKFVLTIKPGITGLAQINGRSDLNFEEEVRLDTYYIEHWSLWLDLKIMFKTIPALLKGYKE